MNNYIWIKKTFFLISLLFITLPLGVSSASVTPPPSANSSSGVVYCDEEMENNECPEGGYCVYCEQYQGYHCPSHDKINGPGYFCIQDESMCNTQWERFDHTISRCVRNYINCTTNADCRVGWICDYSGNMRIGKICKQDMERYSQTITNPAQTSTNPAQTSTEDMLNDMNPLGKLNVNIPGLSEIASKYPVKCEKTGDTESCKIPWVGIYIHAIYNYTIKIIIIIAAIALMIGGVLWLISAGNANRVSQAKNWIKGSLIGLILSLTSYVLLYEINPNLIESKYMRLKKIEGLGGDSTVPSVNGWNGAPYSSNPKKDHLLNIGIECPETGGPSVISTVANSFSGKLVYRLGSKNGLGSDITKKTDPYGLHCPNHSQWSYENNQVVCYDCSGFANQVLWCAGLKTTLPQGSDNIFSTTKPLYEGYTGVKALKIKSCRSGGTEVIVDIGGRDYVLPLTAGDLLGWPGANSTQQYGHVLVYIGGGKMVDAHGNRNYTPGSNAGKAFGHFDVCNTIDDYLNHNKQTDTWFLKKWMPNEWKYE